jgi:hypothetical protein
MAGRSAHLDQLDGPGREIIRQRVDPAATAR